MTDNLQTYFAFGLNMESERLQKWCQGATDRGVARLDGYRFRINKRGKATIIPDSAATTYGRCWDVTPADVVEMDRLEGVKWGSYRRTEVQVDVAGEQLTALVYIARDAENPISAKRLLAKPADYAEIVYGAAQEAGVPDEYLAQLKVELGVVAKAAAPTS